MSTPSLIAKHGHAQPDRSKAISTPSIITEEQGQALLRVVTPVTLSYTDLQGYTIQLWKYKQVFAASVEKNGMTMLIPSRKIHNALLPQEKGSELLQRLNSAKLKKWHFSYKQSTGANSSFVINEKHKTYS